MNTPDIASQELAAVGKTAPRITQEKIDALMRRVIFIGEVPAGTTSTFMHAFLDGKFHLATGHSACVSPENFVAEIGQSLALGDASKKAAHALWQLEGYALYKELAS